MAKEAFDIAWRDQNAVASKAVRRRLKTTAKANCESTAMVMTRRNSTISTASSEDVPKVLSQDYDTYALDFFFTSYVRPHSNLYYDRNFLNSVYLVFQQSSAYSPIRPAVKAVALALLEAWSQLNPNSPQSFARSHYVRGIAALRQHLQNCEEITDDVLIATLMLDMYEGVTSFCAARSHTGMHLKGTKAIIDSRKRLVYSSETSQGILARVRHMVVGRALSQQEPVAPDVLELTPGSQIGVSISPEAELHRLDFELANLQADATDSIPSITNRSLVEFEIFNKAQALDEQFVAWYASIPLEWYPIAVSDARSIPDSVRLAGMYQDYCNIHNSIFVADILNGHSSSRIKLQLLILSTLSSLRDPSLEELESQTQATIQDLADSICASVPYFLGDRTKVLRLDDKSVQYPHLGFDTVPFEHYDSAAAYAGFFLTRRLVELLQPQVPLREGQKMWVAGQLGRIKKVYLISQ